MKKLVAAFFVMFLFNGGVLAQTTYDSTSKVDTNNTSTSTSTVNSNSTNTNNNINTSTVNSVSTNTNVNQNNNVNTSTSTSVNTNNNTNTNINTGHTTSENKNININTNNSTSVSSSTSTSDVTSRNTNNNVNVNTGDMTNRNLNDSKIEQTVKQPPPTAVAPAMMSGGNNDLCSTGTSGAVQTQVLGVSSGGTVRDLNCERLKNAKTLYDMGMKVAAVSIMCQDRRVFDAMWNAGTPCPYEGIIGESAKVAWNNNPDKIPKPEEPKGDDFYKKTSFGALLGALLFGLL